MNATNITVADEIQHDSPATAPDRPRIRRPFSTRGFASILLSVAFLTLVFSGGILYLTPRGRVANWTDWTMLGLGKEQWGALHINMSILFIVVSTLHLILNWSRLVGYIKRKTASGLYMKKEMVTAALVSVVFLGGTVYQLPPFSSVADLHHQIKDYWEVRSEQAPVPHAEQMTLAELGSYVDLTSDDLATALVAEGFDVDDPQLTVRDIALQKDAAPNMVFAAVRKHYPDKALGMGQGPGRGRGMGRGQGGTSACGGEAGEAGCGGDSGAEECGEAAGDRQPGQCAESDAHEHEGEGHGFGRGRGLGLGPGRGMGYGRGRWASQNEDSVDPKPNDE